MKDDNNAVDNGDNIKYYKNEIDGGNRNQRRQISWP